MRKHPLAVAAFLCLTSSLLADQSPFGIVYGPKGAFNLSAPKGWVLDNSAGLEQGLPCVLYRKGDTWQNAEPLMYAKVARSDAADSEAFAAEAIKEMKKERGDFAVERLHSGKTKDGSAYFVNEYAPTKEYPRHERVAYIQMPKAVAYIVFSADTKQAVRKNEGALKQVLDSFSSMEAKIENAPDQSAEP